MVIRTRTFAIPTGPGGHYFIVPSNLVLQGQTFNTGDMTDIVGNWNSENPMSSEHRTKSGGLINGTSGGVTCVNVRATCLNNQHPSFLTTTSGFRSEQDAVGDSHPGEPAVSIPNFLFELKDVPSMLKHAYGRARGLWSAAGKPNNQQLKVIKNYLKAPKNPAEDWLNYNFGWRPLVNDLLDIHKVAGWMNSRAKILNDLSHRKYISRRATLGSKSAVRTVNSVAYNSFGIGITGTAIDAEQLNSWVVAHFKADPFMFRSALSSDYKKLLNLALGLDFAPAMIWDALPWSWLVDWFTEVGGVIHARQNRMGIVFKDGSRMDHRVVTRVIHPVRKIKVSSEPAVIVREKKAREPVGISILPSGLNYLGAGQLTTLASLLVTRIR